MLSSARLVHPVSFTRTVHKNTRWSGLLQSEEVERSCRMEGKNPNDFIWVNRFAQEDPTMPDCVLEATGLVVFPGVEPAFTSVFADETPCTWGYRARDVCNVVWEYAYPDGTWERLEYYRPSPDEDATFFYELVRGLCWYNVEELVLASFFYEEVSDDDAACTLPDGPWTGAGYRL